MDLFSLKDKVAIVTGASRGIGEAIAVAFAAAGARVALASRKQEDLARVAATIQQAGGEAIAVAAHCGKRDDVEKLLADTVIRYGKVDVLVNNAATNPYFGPLIDTPEAAWDKTFEVNLRGYFFAAREVIRHLRDRGATGSIINMASIAGLRAAPFQGCYGMTKAAIISMTKTLATENGPAGIRVNAIAPGLVETRFASAIVQNDTLRNHVIDRTPIGRHAQPQEIVGAALFLASDAGSYVNGHTLVVDGGFTSG